MSYETTDWQELENLLNPDMENIGDVPVELLIEDAASIAFWRAIELVLEEDLG